MGSCSVILALAAGYAYAYLFPYEAYGEEYEWVPTDADGTPWAYKTADDWTWLYKEFTPVFGIYWQGIVPLLLCFLVTTAETIGDVTATIDVSGLPTSGPDANSRVQGGLLADGLASMISALFTSMPNTTFSQNTGVIAATRCANPLAGYFCCAWLMLAGFSGKLAALIGTIPDCVLGGMTTYLFANVAVSGIKTLAVKKMSRRTRFIIAVALGLGVGVAIMPTWAEPASATLKQSNGVWPLRAASVCNEKTLDGLACKPGYEKDLMLGIRSGVMTIIKTPYAFGTLIAVVLNALLPTTYDDKDEPADPDAQSTPDGGSIKQEDLMI